MMTYIFGHKNPDTDTVCASIALAYLKNMQGMKCSAKVLGNINNETKFVLNYFNTPIPSYLNDVRVRIKNVKYDKKAYINEYASIDMAFKLMQKENVTAIPLVDNKKVLTGYVTLKELSKYLINGNRDYVYTTMDNIVDCLNAKVIVNCDNEISGKILIAGLQSKTLIDEIVLNDEDILIVGDRYKILDYAINSHVKLIILPLNVNIDKRLIKKAIKNNVNIIATEYDSFNVATKISLSNYVKNINANKSPVTINNEDYYTDFITMSHKTNHTNYPVVNNAGVCLGLIRLTGPNKYDKQKVILVDHNNLSQSVDGIEEADILEIIDHHNLGAIGTKVPINFQSKPVGCTCTIIYEMYKDAKIKIPKDIAGLMLSAILSDTLLLTSPTTTSQDKETAESLAKIANLDIDTYGLEMLRAASSIEGLSVKELINSDFKQYIVDSKTIGIGQIMTLDFNTIKNNLEEFINNLEDMVNTNYSMVVLFITDIIRNGSYVIYNKNSEDIIKEAFGIKNIYEGVFISKVVSRKKQILPSILSVMED